MGKVSVQGNARRGTNPRLVQIMERAAAQSPYDVVIFSGARPGGRRGSQHHGNSAIDMVLIDPQTGQELPNYKTASTYPQYETFARAARQAQQELYPDLSNQFRWGGWFDQGGPDLMHFDLGSGGMRLGGWESGLNSYGQQVYARQGPGFVYSHTQRSAAPTTRYANLWGREDFNVAQQGVAPTPDMVRDAQEYLNQNGITVPVTGRLDDATAAAVKAWRSTVPGTAFAERYGLQRPSEAPQSAADAANMMAGQPQAQARAMAYAPEQGAAQARPPVKMRIAAETPPQLPSLNPQATPPNTGRMVQTTPASGGMYSPIPGNDRGGMPPLPQRLADPQSLPWGEGMRAGGLPPPEKPMVFEDINFPTTTAPMPRLTSQGAPALPPNPADLATTMPGVWQQPPVDIPNFIAQQGGAFRANTDRAAGIPVMPPAPPPAVGVPVDYAPPGAASPFPRPNPTPPGQRPLRSGRTPNGFQWQQIPQRGGPSLLQVVSPKGKRWTEVIGPPGGAGLFNEFASSFTPVRRG